MSQKNCPDGGPWAILETEPGLKFVVMGDAHANIESVMPLVKIINRLDPEFILFLGDSTSSGSPEEWQRSDRIMDALHVPAIMIPGNHDVYNHQTRKRYERRYGRTYFSFDYGEVHFLALDSEMPDKDGNYDNRIEGEQLEWLERDLGSNQTARARFVFVHRPFWANLAEVSQGLLWMREVHPLLAKYCVNAVFAGHFHRYMKFDPLDGVHYYISGAAAGTFGEKRPGGKKLAEGDLQHFCLVSVRGEKWKAVVITPKAILPDTIVRYKNFGTPGLLYSIRADFLEVREGTNQIVLNVKNVLDSNVEVLVEPNASPDSSWKISPQAQNLSVASGEKREIRFQGTLDEPQERYPGPKFTVAIRGAETKVLTTEVIVPISALRTAHCQKVAKPPKIDGKLDDQIWQECSTLSAFWEHTAQQHATFRTEVRTAYDDRNLYLAFRCHEPNLPGLVTRCKSGDGLVWFDDSIEIFLDPRQDQESALQLVANANAVLYYGSGRCGEKWNPRCRAKAGRESGAWTLEIALAWENLGITRPEPGMKMGLELVRNRAQQPCESTQWSPTFGSNLRPGQFGTMVLA